MELGCKTIGKYEIRERLGAGAMGQVLVAFDTVLERRAALKVLLKPVPGDLEGSMIFARFKREAQAAGRLNHPNLVAVYDYGEDDSRAWIAMELVEGGTLQEALDRGERYSMSQVVRLMDQVLAGLAYSHKHGVVHRDVKPSNIMLTEDGTAKLADFGIARIENSSLTQVGTVMGTPSYMAPEQLRGEAVDCRADIWACGVLLYQLLTGEKPFEGGFSALLHKALYTEPPPPSSLSVTALRGVDSVVARALAKRPEDRFSTASAFALALRAATATPTLLVGDADATRVAAPLRTPTSPMQSVGKQPRRLLTFLLASATLVTMGVAVFMVLQPRLTDPAAVSGELPFPRLSAEPLPPSAGAAPPVPNPATSPLPSPSEPQRIDYRAAAAAAAAAPACALLAARGTDSSLTLQGVVRASDVATLRAVLAQHNIAHAAANLFVQTFEGPYCPVLDLLRSVLGAEGAVLQVAVPSGTQLRSGDFLRFTVEMPDWRGLLHAVYLTSSGEVTHLVQLEPYQAGATARLGEARAGFPDWEVAEPFGTDLLLAIVSDAPIFPAARPTTEPQSNYLAALDGAIRTAIREGRRVVVRALVLETADR